MHADALVFAGFAVQSSVGRSYPESCASIRAGLSRPAPLPGTQLVDEASQEAVPVIGHPVRGLTDGFFGPGLWLRLAQLCLTELVHRAVVAQPEDRAYWSRSALLLLTPDPNGERFDPDDLLEPDYVRRMVLETLVQQGRLPLAADALFTMPAGCAALYWALAQSVEQVAAGRFDRFVVIAVDSLLDDLTLGWLERQGRLKGPDTPSGLMPGEAGVALVIERAGSGPSDVRTQVALHAVQYGSRMAGAAPLPGAQGARLAAVVDAALAQARVEGMFTGPVFCDLNGEAWKAEAVACARMELLERLDPDADWSMPCASVGDVGAAMAGIAIACASWQALRVQRGGGPVLVFGLDHEGDAGALLLGATH